MASANFLFFLFFIIPYIILNMFADYLLDDLQSSVMQSKEMQYLAPSNTTTIIRERSTSPGGGVSFFPFNCNCNF